MPACAPAAAATSTSGFPVEAITLFLGGWLVTEVDEAVGSYFLGIECLAFRERFLLALGFWGLSFGGTQRDLWGLEIVCLSSRIGC